MRRSFRINWVVFYNLNCQMTSVSAFAFVFVVGWHQVALL